MIRIACHSENFGSGAPDEILAFIKRLGFHAVDIAARSMLPQERIVADPRGAAAWMRGLAEKHGLALSELFLSAVQVEGRMIQPTDPAAPGNTAYERSFQAICEFAAAAGFESVMGSGGESAGDEALAAVFDRCAAVYSRMTRIAEEAGISFNVEPSRQSLLKDPAVALEMAKAVPGLGYTLDLLHYHANGYAQEESMTLLPYTRHMHVRQAARGWGKCPYELGELDYDLLIKRLRGLRWTGTLTLEYWCGSNEHAANISAVEQNILMGYELKALIRKYYGDYPMQQ